MTAWECWAIISPDGRMLGAEEKEDSAWGWLEVIHGKHREYLESEGYRSVEGRFVPKEEP